MATITTLARSTPRSSERQLTWSSRRERTAGVTSSTPARYPRKPATSVARRSVRRSAMRRCRRRPTRTARVTRSSAAPPTPIPMSMCPARRASRRSCSEPGRPLRPPGAARHSIRARRSFPAASSGRWTPTPGRSAVSTRLTGPSSSPPPSGARRTSRRWRPGRGGSTSRMATPARCAPSDRGPDSIIR